MIQKKIIHLFEFAIIIIHQAKHASFTLLFSFMLLRRADLICLYDKSIMLWKLAENEKLSQLLNPFRSDYCDLNFYKFNHFPRINSKNFWKVGRIRLCVTWNILIKKNQTMSNFGWCIHLVNWDRNKAYFLKLLFWQPLRNFLNSKS